MTAPPATSTPARGEPSAPIRSEHPDGPAADAETPRHSATAWVRGAQVLAILGVTIFAASVRVIVSGEREIADSTAALRAGDPYEATVHARRAAGWYAPGAPHVRVAYDRLVALAATAEGLGDSDAALFAWRAIRTAALETRWVVTPHAADLARANAAIARLSAARPRPPAMRTEPTTAIERRQLELLLRDEAPDTSWIAALLAGFTGWVAGAVWLVRRGISTTGHVVWRRARPALLLTACGIALWLLAMWRA